MPFSYSVYDQTFNSVTVSSNGNAQFTTSDTAFSNVCLPWTSPTTPSSRIGTTSAPMQIRLRELSRRDLRHLYPVSGTAPNRIFNIEWRAVYFANTATRPTTN